MLAALLLLPAPALAQAGEAELLRALESAVDAPSPGERRKKAQALAKRSDVSLEEWLALLPRFGRFDPVVPGEARYVAPLRVEGGVEETEVFVHVPASYDPGVAAPLMLMFHGSGGDGRGQTRMWREVAEPLGMLVVAPSETGANEGYGWTERERASALECLRWTRRAFNVDENRVFASGVSRGGHLAWDLALRHPGTFAALAPMIGGPRIQIRGGQNNFRYLENVAQLPIRDLQGAQDDPRLVLNLRMAFERLRGFGASDAQLVEFEALGHAFDFAAVDWTLFLGSARRDPLAERVVRTCAREGEGRALWVEVLELEREIAEEFRPELAAGDAAQLDDEGMRRFLMQATGERTARVEVRRLAPGRIEARSRGVRELRLLLTPAMLDEAGALEVLFDGRPVKKKPRGSKSVLLEEFVERFDRTFLPLAEVEVK